MSSTEIVLPAVHLNGTSRTNLLHDYRRAYAALCDAAEAFARIEFHPRDYYILEGEAFPKAQAEREVILFFYGKAKAYLEAHLVHLTK